MTIKDPTGQNVSVQTSANASMVFLGFDMAVEETELRETCDAWARYIDRLSKSTDSRDRHLVTLALLRRGTAYITLKEWDAAIADFKRVLGGQQPEAEEVRAANMMLGAIYTELWEDEQAIACYTAVLEPFEKASRKEAKQYAEQFPLLYLYRGMLYGRLKKYQEAIADCDHALKYGHTSAEVYSVRGISYAYLGDLDRALTDCTQAVELEQSASCYNRLGEVHFMRRDYRQALDAFTQASELDPSNEQTQANRSRALFSLMMTLFEPGASTVEPGERGVEQPKEEGGNAA